MIDKYLIEMKIGYDESEEIWRSLKNAIKICTPPNWKIYEQKKLNEASNLLPE